MSKVILVPIDPFGKLNLDDIRKAFKQAKADARKDKAVSTSEGGKQHDPKTA